MLEWILDTLVTALPFLIPVIVLLAARVAGYRWKAQQTAVRAALVFYVLSLLAFLAHGMEFNGTIHEAFRAFYGDPAEKTLFCILGYLAQALATVALLFAVNWRVIRLFYGEDVMASPGKSDFLTALIKARQQKEKDQ